MFDLIIDIIGSVIELITDSAAEAAADVAAGAATVAAGAAIAAGALGAIGISAAAIYGAKKLINKIVEVRKLRRQRLEEFKRQQLAKFKKETEGFIKANLDETTKRVDIGLSHISMYEENEEKDTVYYILYDSKNNEIISAESEKIKFRYMDNDLYNEYKRNKGIIIL